VTEIDTSRERIERLRNIGCADYLHEALLARAEAAEAERDRLRQRAHEALALERNRARAFAAGYDSVARRED